MTDRVIDRPRPSVLVVEDEPSLRQVIVEGLEADGFAVAQALDGADAIERLHGFAYDAWSSTCGCPTPTAWTSSTRRSRCFPTIRAVVITGFGGVERGGHRDQARRDRLPDQAVPAGAAVARAARRHRAAAAAPGERRAARAAADRFRFDNIIGRSAAMRTVFSTLELVAPMNSTVLIQGETGTGKELIARTIHHNSPRHDQQFVAFNAAAIPEGLAEAELFGHVKGAFTGAVQARVGRFELAHRGTLFIDEVVVDVAAAAGQAAARAAGARDRARRRIASRSSSTSASSPPPTSTCSKMVKEGTFREDLYYRLNVVPVSCRRCATRREDIPLLAQHFVQQVVRGERPGAADDRPGGDARADGLLVAGQHPAARERDRARGRDERRGTAKSRRRCCRRKSASRPTR